MFLPSFPASSMKFPQAASTSLRTYFPMTGVSLALYRLAFLKVASIQMENYLLPSLTSGHCGSAQCSSPQFYVIYWLPHPLLQRRCASELPLFNNVEIPCPVCGHSMSMSRFHVQNRAEKKSGTSHETAELPDPQMKCLSHHTSSKICHINWGLFCPLDPAI